MYAILPSLPGKIDMAKCPDAYHNRRGQAGGGGGGGGCCAELSNSTRPRGIRLEVTDACDCFTVTAQKSCV